MNKRFILIGFLLLIAGFLLAASAWNGVSPSSVVGVGNQTIVIAPNSEAYSIMKLNSTGFVVFAFSSGTTPINLYIVKNASFPEVWQDFETGNMSYQSLAEFEGNSILVAMENTTRSIYPYNSTWSTYGFTAPAYVSNSSGMLGSGTYYVIYKNPTNYFANTTYRYIIPNSGLLAKKTYSSSTLGAAGVASALLVIGGLVLVVFGLFSGNGKTAAAQRETQIASMYEKINKKGKRRPSRGRKANGTGR